MSQLDSMSFCIFCESYSKNRPVGDLAGEKWEQRGIFKMIVEAFSDNVPIQVPAYLLPLTRSIPEMRWLAQGTGRELP